MERDDYPLAKDVPESSAKWKLENGVELSFEFPRPYVLHQRKQRQDKIRKETAGSIKHKARTETAILGSSPKPAEVLALSIKLKIENGVEFSYEDTKAYLLEVGKQKNKDRDQVLSYANEGGELR